MGSVPPLTRRIATAEKWWTTELNTIGKIMKLKKSTGDGKADADAALAHRADMDREALRLRSVPSWEWPDPDVPRSAPSEQIIKAFERGRK